MKLGVLTSSRADFGIYLPLLNKLLIDSFFDVEIIAFGTHTMKSYGETVNEIEANLTCTIHKIKLDLEDDSPKGISDFYGKTVIAFADFWSNNSYDLVLCLGDRYEMSAAVQSCIPFRLTLAHIHGGETTLGAIDNIYRDQISIGSHFHFTAADSFSKKVENLKHTDKNIVTVGALSLDDIANFKPEDKTVFFDKFSLEMAPYILVTFHPETVDVDENQKFANEMANALFHLSKTINLVVTMPNADTLGSLYRTALKELKLKVQNIKLIENFGKYNYFNAMHYSAGLLGNTSSGIIEAASFGKYVVNVGNRQEGRLTSNNILQTSFKAEDIIANTIKVIEKGDYKGDNVYFKNGAADGIINTLKEYYD